MMSLILTLICGSALLILWGLLVKALETSEATFLVGGACIGVVCATLMTAFDVLYKAISRK